MNNIYAKHLCQYKDLGLISYEEAYRIQQEAWNDVIKTRGHKLFFCEHDPVFTLGKLAKDEHFLLSQESIQKKGIKVLRIDRGGEVTFHGPGQIVAYPIFDLNVLGKDLKAYIRKLEQVAIDFLQHFDIVASSVEGKTGAWVGNRKIASIGIGVKKWVSYHGIGINVNTDLNFFKMVRPCGLDVEMISLQALLGASVDLKDAKTKLLKSFARHFELKFA
ncbi:MAG: lipoyl(octanoyl) transferase LipB [Candidatus Omnitrophota bacterium]